jgi:hypothetical protein
MFKKNTFLVWFSEVAVLWWVGEVGIGREGILRYWIKRSVVCIAVSPSTYVCSADWYSTASAC